MHTLFVNDLQVNVSELLETLSNGQSIELLEKQGNNPIAMIIPFVKAAKAKRKLGLLEGKGEVIIKEDFKMTEKELIGM